MPRLPLLDEAGLRASGVLDRAPKLAGLEERQPETLLAVIGHAGPVAAAWLEFAGALHTKASLPARLRELVILRVASRTQSSYVWSAHATIAAAHGLTDAEIAALADGPTGWNAIDSVAIRACDELLDRGEISEPVWVELAKSLSPAELVELVMVVGNYQLVAWLCAALEIEPEPGLPPLPSR